MCGRPLDLGSHLGIQSPSPSRHGHSILPLTYSLVYRTLLYPFHNGIDVASFFYIITFAPHHVRRGHESLPPDEVVSTPHTVP